MIKTEALSFSYADGTQALREINLEVRDGEFLALMGANGCGKTTLLKHFIGLLKPSSGKVFLNGKEFRFFKEEEIFERVGMVFQDPNDQLFASTVEQDVTFGAVNLGLKPDEASLIMAVFANILSGVSSIMRLLRKLNRERGITMVMATHDVELVPLFCDRVAIMGQGKIIGEETPERIFANTAMIREAELRLPRVSHLIEILKKEDEIH